MSDKRVQFSIGFIVVLCLVIGLITIVRTSGPSGPGVIGGGATVPFDSVETDAAVAPKPTPDQR